MLMLTLIPCMCISPLNGVHSSFSLDSGSSMIFPLRDDKTSPDPDAMPSSWISLKHSRYFVTLRPHDFFRLYFAMFCGQQSWSDRSQTLTRDIIIIVGREFLRLIGNGNYTTMYNYFSQGRQLKSDILYHLT